MTIAHPVLPSTLLSVHPRFAEALLSGLKTVEVRRRRAHLAPGSVALLYATSPQCQVVGAVRIEAIDVASPDELWSAVGAQTAISHDEFTGYLAGRPEGCAIRVSTPVTFSTPIALTELRRRQGGFVTPQSYRFLPTSESVALLGGVASELRPLARGPERSPALA